MDRLFPEKPGRNSMDDEADPATLRSPDRKWHAVLADRNGYLQRVEHKALLGLAQEHETIVRMELGIGDFVVENTPLVSLAMENPPDEEIISEPTLLYHNDIFMDGPMRHQRLGRDEVLQVVRSKGIAAMSEVGSVIMETDGSFRVLPGSHGNSEKLLSSVSKARL